MKKIQKMNLTASQSVYSFYCPCSGSCEPYCGCNLLVDLSTDVDVNTTYQYNPQAATTV